MSEMESLKKKILMVFLGYTGDGSSMSGGDTYFIEISRRLMQNYDITILTTFNGAKLLDTQRLRTRTYVISSSLIGRMYWFFDYLWRVMVTFWKIPSLKPNFDLVISTSPLLPDIITTSLISMIKRTKPVIYHHGFTTPIMLNKYNIFLRIFALSIQRRFLTLILKWLPFTIFALPMAKKDLMKLGVKERQILIMMNGIDTKTINQVKASAKAFDGVFMGSLISRKGVIELPKMWGDVVKKFPNANLAILGTGPLLEKIKTEIDNLNLKNNIIILGSIMGPIKYAFLKASKIFVFPSYSESWSIAVCEAMYCGLPCILYKSEAYDAYMDGVIELPVGDREKFVETINNLLSDSAFRKNIGEKAKEISSRFDWDNIVSDHDKNLRKILHLMNNFS